MRTPLPLAKWTSASSFFSVPLPPSSWARAAPMHMNGTSQSDGRKANMGELRKDTLDGPPFASYLTNATDCLLLVNHLIEILQQVRDRIFCTRTEARVATSNARRS